MWVFFLCCHLIGLVGYNLLLRKSLLAQVDKWLLGTLMQTGIALPLLCVIIFYHPVIPHINAEHIGLLIAATLLVILLQWSNVNALARLEVGVYSVLYNLRIVLTTILGVVFLSESIVILQISGGLLIFAAIATVRQQGKRSTTVTGIYWGVLAAITISCLNVIEKDLVTTIGILYYTLPVMVGAAAIMWIVLLIRSHQQKQSIPWGTLCTPTLFWLMALRAVSAYGFLAAFQTGALLSVASYISSLSVIILMILGAVWFNERDYPKQKIAAVILSVVGLTCILFAQLP